MNFDEALGVVKQIAVDYALCLSAGSAILALLMRDVFAGLFLFALGAFIAGLSALAIWAWVLWGGDE